MSFELRCARLTPMQENAIPTRENVKVSTSRHPIEARFAMHPKRVKPWVRPSSRFAKSLRLVHALWKFAARCVARHCAVRKKQEQNAAQLWNRSDLRAALQLSESSVLTNQAELSPSWCGFHDSPWPAHARRRLQGQMSDDCC